MQTEFEYVRFEKQTQSFGKTQRWNCVNKKSKTILTVIHWENGWRQYVSDQLEPGMIFSAGCHEDIAKFLRQLNEEHKKIVEKNHAS